MLVDPRIDEPAKFFVLERSAILLDETAQQILLQRLVRRCRTPPEDRMRLVRDILDLDARHGAIMALLHADDQRPGGHGVA